jgi:hypothetical protein
MITWKIGSTKSINWNFPDVLSNVKIEISRNSGSTYSTIISATPNTGSYIWIVTSAATTSAVIRISGLVYTDPDDGSTIDFSDIVATTPEFTISLSGGVSNANLQGNVLNGESVTIVHENLDGNHQYMVFVDSSSRLRVARQYFDYTNRILANNITIL